MTSCKMTSLTTLIARSFILIIVSGLFSVPVRAQDASTITYTQAGSGAVTQTVQSKLQKGVCASPYDFGAVGNGSADDTTAITNWLSLVTSAPAQRAPCLFLPTGIFRVTSDLVVTMPAHSHGPRIWGTCAGNSRIAFDPGYSFKLTSSTAMFYGDFRCIGFTGSIDGPLVTFATSLTDALNGFNIDNVTANNNSSSPANIGMQFNAIYTSRVFGTANCDGARHGIGIQITAGAMNTMKLAGGNCNVGLHLTNNVNSVNGNVFDAVDLEENNIQLLIDGSAVQGNLFLGGILASNRAGDVGVSATAGIGNILKNMAYGGLGTLFGSKIGIIWENPLQDLTSTPAIPASNTALTNSFAQPVTVNLFGGTVSNVKAGGTQVCNMTPCMVVLMPGATITLTYTTVPSWTWRALQL